MTVQPNEIFSRITDQQKRALYDLLIRRRIIILCKNNADEIFKLLPIQFEKEKYLVSELVPKGQKINPQGPIVCSFNIDEEKYFIHSRVALSENGKWWRIDGSFDVYKLQRRQAYRISIPPTYKTAVKVQDTKNKALISEGSILDISSGGCKLVLKGHSSIQNGDIVDLRLTFGKREPLDVTAEIRHVQKITTPKPQESIGAMFKTLSSTLDSNLFAITLELHRELTGKVSK